MSCVGGDDEKSGYRDEEAGSKGKGSVFVCHGGDTAEQASFDWLGDTRIPEQAADLDALEVVESR